MAMDNPRRHRRKSAARTSSSPMTVFSSLEKRYFCDLLIHELQRDQALSHFGFLVQSVFTNSQIQALLKDFSGQRISEMDTTESLRMLRRWVRYGVILRERDEDQEETPLSRSGVSARIRRLIVALRDLRARCAPYRDFKGLQILRRLYTLMPHEVDLIKWIFFRGQSNNMSAIINHYDDLESLVAQADFIGLPRPLLEDCIKPGSRLFTWGLLMNSATESGMHRAAPDEVRLARSVESLLLEGTAESFFRRIGERPKGPVFPLESFPLLEEEVTTLKALTSGEKPCQILFWGTPGTGKTTLACSLAAQAGKNAFMLAQGDEGDLDDRQFALTWAKLRLHPERDLLIVDEADSLLNRVPALFRTDSNPAKSWLNAYLDESPLQIVWIVNDWDSIHPSVRRRFHFNLEFKALAERQKIAMWKSLVRRNKVARYLRPGLIEELARSYPLTTGSMQTSLEALLRLGPEVLEKPDQAENYLRLLMDKQTRLLELQPATKLADLSPYYDPSLLNCDTDLKQVQASLQGFFAARDKRQKAGNLNVLLSGAPGTGKTEWVKHLGQVLDRRIEVYRASDLLNPYVGVTEKRIADMFRHGEDPSVLLFIDEADSLFFTRAEAQQSWEISRTNELLTHMDQFSGALVCATNFLDKLDPAVLRRFAWKIRFEPLRPEALVQLVEKQFGSLRFRPAERAEMTGWLSLTPGDIRAVWNRLRFQPALDSAGVLAALKTESAYKPRQASGRIGF